MQAGTRLLTLFPVEYQYPSVLVCGVCVHAHGTNSKQLYTDAVAGGRAQHAMLMMQLFEMWKIRQVRVYRWWVLHVYILRCLSARLDAVHKVLMQPS